MIIILISKLTTIFLKTTFYYGMSLIGFCSKQICKSKLSIVTISYYALLVLLTKKTKHFFTLVHGKHFTNGCHYFYPLPRTCWSEILQSYFPIFCLHHFLNNASATSFLVVFIFQTSGLHILNIIQYHVL